MDQFEVLEEFLAGVEDLGGEDVLLAVDPEVGEAFLGGVEDLGEVAEAPFFVEDFVGLGELLSVASSCTISLKDLTKSFYLI